MPKKKEYALGIDYTPEQMERLRRFVGVTGAKSVRRFVAEALDAEIDRRLMKMKPSEREAVMKLIGSA